MAQTVLDRLREVIPDERRKGGTPQREARSRVYVTPSGKVVFGDQAGEGEERMLSEVHPAVFAAPER